GTLSKLTRRFMGNRKSSASGGNVIEDEHLDESALGRKIGYLSVMELFRDFTPEEMQEIDRVTRMQTCTTGRVFYSPEETGEVLFILKKGAVQIYRMSPEGRKLVIANLPPYSFFGEMSCIGQGMYDTFAEATEESLICTMSRADVERLLLSKPKVALRILEAVGKRVVDAERQLEELAFKGLIPRIAALLLREADGDEVQGLSHQDIAERLGVYRETATSALNELKTAGIIEIGRKRIKITARQRLERAASE
ncbi:MAG TPA: Crp/Fnr family transcriptional regulator, partial [Pyrinomonadaceae bacterium]|nr:Crp/Fnr family transcriptional regulator [Pyrinomonadaceae bacterium]